MNNKNKMNKKLNFTLLVLVLGVLLSVNFVHAEAATPLKDPDCGKKVANNAALDQQEIQDTYKLSEAQAKDIYDNYCQMKDFVYITQIKPAKGTTRNYHLVFENGDVYLKDYPDVALVYDILKIDINPALADKALFSFKRCATENDCNAKPPKFIDEKDPSYGTLNFGTINNPGTSGESVTSGYGVKKDYFFQVADPDFGVNKYMAFNWLDSGGTCSDGTCITYKFSHLDTESLLSVATEGITAEDPFTTYRKMSIIFVSTATDTNSGECDPNAPPSTQSTQCPTTDKCLKGSCVKSGGSTGGNCIYQKDPAKSQDPQCKGDVPLPPTPLVGPPNPDPIKKVVDAFFRGVPGFGGYVCESTLPGSIPGCVAGAIQSESFV